MAKKKKRQAMPLFLLALMVMVLAACPQPANPPTTTTFPPLGAPQGSGTAIVRHGCYLYKIGGMDAAGSVISTIMMAKISLDASNHVMPLEWTELAPLPEARAFAAVFAAGNLMFVIGGDDNSGPTSTVYYTSINTADGTLGFGTARFWEQDSIALADSRSHAAWAIYDGRIFLIGGKNWNGPVDSIVHARIYPGGLIGQWYTSPKKLPSPLYGAASAIHDDMLYVTGGMNASEQAMDELVSFTIGSKGLLEDIHISALPKALYLPMLLSDDDSLILAGGYDSNHAGSQAVYRMQGGAWRPEAQKIAAEGPSSGRAAGTLFYSEQSSAMGSPGVGLDTTLDLVPDYPIIVPGSGLVPVNTPIRLRKEPGVTVRYRTDTNEVGGADLVWDQNNPKKIASATAYGFRGFSSDGLESQQIHMQYFTRSTGFMISVSDTIHIKNLGADLDTINIRDNIYDIGSTALAAVWCRLNVYSSERLTLSFADANSPGLGSGYSGRIKLSLFEGDFYTEALDVSGVPVLDRMTGDKDQPILLTLHPGTYYLRIEDINALTGRTLGLAVSRR